MRQILKAAVARLCSKVEYTSLPAFPMANEFTLTELHEIVPGRDLEKKTFGTRILATDLVEEVPGRRRAGRWRPAQLCRLRSRKLPVFFAQLQRTALLRKILMRRRGGHGC